MTQKDKVKELVGRGLHSYHTKALQQIDRIEKKNKEQNHKISILTNELDNDYLTKTEEGSVVSLEYSEEGMVYLDELQGNTLVNYCTDGSKEMTLNGDIDVEGTFVTTTEGVDNGKVDVMCEGNTLVNKLYKIKNYGSEFGKHGWGNSPNCSKFEWIDNGIKMYALSSDTKLDRYYRSSPDKYGIFKKNRTYVVRMNVNSNDLQQNATILRCFYGNGTVFMNGQMSEVINGVFIKKATTSSTIEEVDAIHSMISLDYSTLQGVDGWVSFQNVMVIDVTDLPSYQQDVEYWRNIEYFEGMKSVGQDDENGHKIEILSTTKNLFSTWKQGNILENGTEDTSEKNVKSDFISVLPNTKYICSNNGVKRATHFVFYDKDKQHIGSTSRNNPSEKCTTPYNCRFVRLTGASNLRDKTQFEIGETITPYNSTSSLNKKEILLNEPLRGLPNGVKDRFVKIGGKWYIERNCVGYTPDTSTATFRKNYDVTSIIDFKIDNIKNSNQSAQSFHIECLSTIPYGDTSGTKWQNETHWLKYYPMTKNTISTEGQRVKGSVSIFYNKEWTDQQIIDWCNNNNLKFILPCETPTYEEITDVELITYLDTTHISNNSIIPCNMKIQNTGYNAIIKPSTLYTVALDTNKSGTIGMNLGGAKGTTTNNVLTLTTPATLSDDSLRLYGKDIKGSKVRLLEGDKTNWIPSHFEGMKSSFEDKVQSDGTYKMEILSNNSNVFNLKNCIQSLNSKSNCVEEVPNGFKTIQGKSQMYNQTICKFNPKGKYKVSYDIISVKPNGEIATQTSWFIRVVYKDGSEERIYNPNGRIEFITKDKLIQDINMAYGTTQNISTITNIKITEINSNITEEQKSNKIQFSSIEPLRGVGNVKDKFVFKDNRLMIERNYKDTIFDGIKNVCSYMTSQSGKTTKYGQITFENGGKIVADSLSYRSSWGSDVEGIETNGIAIGIRLKNAKLDLTKSNPMNEYLKQNPIKITYLLEEPTYEEIPFELQKIILEGYENGTLFFDTNIPPTSIVTYAGETPIVKATKLNKTEVLSNTNDINDNIVPYLMDMDYRVVCLQLQSEGFNGGIEMARLFGGTYEMLQRDILSKRYSIEEYKYRLDAYLSVNKITEKEYEELGEMLNE